MGSSRVVDPGLSDSDLSNQHIVYGVFHEITPPATNFIDQHGSAYDFGELEEVIMPELIQGVGIVTGGDRKPLFSVRPRTLEIFPSWPMRVQQTIRTNSLSTDLGSAQNTASCRADAQVEPESPVSGKSSDQFDQRQQQSDAGGAGTALPLPKILEKKKGAGSSLEKDGSKASEAKTLRRLAQNREAAKKSRLRKKAYVQQLESSKLKLSQLEQDLQKTRSQGLFLAGGGGGGGNISSGAAMFDMEHSKWLEEDQRHISELRGSLHAHLPDGDLRIIVDSCLAHHDEIFRLKGVAVKADVFHLITGSWVTPTERCFLWMAGFRPSELLKILVPQLEPLTEQQFMGIYNLQQSSQQAEDALSQGLEHLQLSLADTVAGGSLGDGTDVGNYMGQMATALSKVVSLESFVLQADNLRQQTLHQLHRILTIRQAARCFLAIGEYYSRLRGLSHLWATVQGRI